MKSLTSWTGVMWFGNVCLAAGCISLLSPAVASTALFPWMAYTTGNTIWLIDSFMKRSWPWVAMASFFSLWNVLIMVSRVSGIEAFTFLSPIVNAIEQILL